MSFAVVTGRGAAGAVLCLGEDRCVRGEGAGGAVMLRVLGAEAGGGGVVVVVDEGEARCVVEWCPWSRSLPG